MDLEDFRAILGKSGADIWAFIDAAIGVASSDYPDEIRCRRDGIVEKLYTACSRCNMDGNGLIQSNAVAKERENTRQFEHRSPATPSEESLLDLLQTLADMDITFKALKETDIGRYVNRLRKHPSSEVRRLVKLLVRKWKDLVDEWVRSNTPGEVNSSNNLMADGDSPQRDFSKNQQNGHHSQVPDFAYSPNPHNGSSGSDKNYSESEPRPKAAAAAAAARRDAPARPFKSPCVPASAPPPNRPKEVVIDPDRLASARKRLQENYQEAQKAKKQRTIQVMDIHEIPKPRNGFFAKNKGGFQRH
ncbi:hypothetical protein Cgig2_017737 [Carnegiea gigantea]|uniref:TFIIS N-terminal domain-containing protein n=1 Tax=Carnegiea gigantea TaxID=171969 RepID=A0A9Q1JIR8_9CARY|nr:hypothetical protein Cgig2_017737 [Carnegiea gigantea]